MRRFLLCFSLLATPLAAQTADTPLPPDQAALKAHVLFLAADAMKGRDTGSPEHDIAANYVASQFYAAGLKPAGDDGSYLQRVPLVEYRASSPGKVKWRGRTLRAGTDFYPHADATATTRSLAAPVVFVGYGIVAPQYGRDDFAGVDMKGKIVAFFGGSPAAMTGEERAYLGSSTTKTRLAADRGAIGAIVLTTPLTEKMRPFARAAKAYDGRHMTWSNPDGTGHTDSPIPLLATLSLSGAEKLFAGAATPWATVRAEAAKPDAAFRSIALPGTLSVATTTRHAPATSSNVAALLPGSDPRLANEVVVLSAHLDHIGVSKTPVNGDAINNGALDNAIGIASLIEEAKKFTGVKPPRRSILFLAVTAEEKGLIGSDWYARHPTLPGRTIVANVNLDMPILTYRFEDMVAFGGDRSTLGPIIRRAVKAVGVELSPDPIPDEGIFVRSDHFRFVQQGIPSVFLWPGQKGPGKPAVTDFLANCYHKPCDDLAQPILWDQGARFVDANYRIAREIADADRRPVWNKGDYFGTLFRGPMAD